MRLGIRSIAVQGGGSLDYKPKGECAMSYKIVNGSIWVMYEGKWWLDSILYMLYPELKARGLVRA